MKKTIIRISLSTVLIFSLLSPVFAVTPIEGGADVSNFKSIYDVNPVDLTLPKPLSVTLPNAQDFGVAVIETKTKKAQPYSIIRKINLSYPSATVVKTSAIREFEVAKEDSNAPGGITYEMIEGAASFVDRDPATVSEFDIDADGGSASIEISFDRELTSSALNLELDDHVAPPYMTSIEAEVGGEWITALANQMTYSTYITFPERTAKNWRINFSHSQPLRIREINLQDSNTPPEEAMTEVVWLAKQGETYQVYADAVIYKPIKTGELGNLFESPDDIEQGSVGKKQENSAYKDPDSDFDGIPNFRDNCVNLDNPKQEDLDNNKRGDACEDHDKDGVMDAVDNCPQDTNSNQKDTDGDKIGDTCDGEESRPTEKMPWLPWVGMGGAALVVVGVIFMTLNKDKPQQ